MTVSTARQPDVPASALAGFLPLALALGLFVAVFQREWALDDAYSYGYLVPFFSLYLFHVRWAGRPTPGGRGAGYPWFALGCVILLLPLRIVQVANPDWRAAQWALALCLYGFVLSILAAWGGVRWARHFAVALGVLLLAVPWPTGFERALTQGLMHWVAGVTVELLNLLGVFAERQGNVIRTAAGLIGVEEACSGVRSLQATLMSAVVLGELFYLRRGHRAGLLLAGLALSLFLNGVRTFLLTLLAVGEGAESVRRLHDPVGQGVAVLAFVLLFAMAWGARRLRAGATGMQTAVESVPPSSLVWTSAWSAGIVGVLLASWLWFPRPPEPQPLALDWSKAAPFVREVEVPAATRALLRYSDGGRWEWEIRGVVHCVAFSFAWNAGDISGFANVHRPEVCLPATGLRMVGEGPVLSVTLSDGVTLTLDALEFSGGTRSYHVFHAVWENGARAAPKVADWRTRLLAAWRGERITSRQSIELVVSGARTWEEAALAARDGILSASYGGHPAYYPRGW